MSRIPPPARFENLGHRDSQSVELTTESLLRPPRHFGHLFLLATSLVVSSSSPVTSRGKSHSLMMVFHENRSEEENNSSWIRQEMYGIMWYSILMNLFSEPCEDLYLHGKTLLQPHSNDIS